MFTLSTALPEETKTSSGLLMIPVLVLAVCIAFAVSAFVTL
jgi:hypothetical protein